MTDVDQFESAFKSAIKAVYQYQPAEFKHVLVVTDLEPHAANSYADSIKDYLSLAGEQTRWTALSGESFSSVGQLLDLLKEHQPDLICTYRNLHSGSWRWPFSLGDYVDVIVQQGSCPVLLLTRPDSADNFKDTLPSDTLEVMAVTDHLTGDDRLVNFAVSLTNKRGKLFLTHVEDQATYDRYIDTIGKIPAIDTELAKELILTQLLKEPHDYIESCKQVLLEQGLNITIEQIITVGHRISQYRQLVDEHGVDLLVMHGRDQEQVAMHGVAYPLAVELRGTPLLLL